MTTARSAHVLNEVFARNKLRLPAPPKTLGTAGRRLWRRIVEDYVLDGAGLIILESACMNLDRETDATAAIAREGMTTVDRFGQAKVHPAVLIERDARAGKLRALKQLNLDVEPVRPTPGRPPK
jgi:phage terminase small subunit